jgi:hypothetical protein
MEDVIIFEESNSLVSADFAALEQHVLAAHTDVYQHFSCASAPGNRGANKTPFEQQVVMADFAELEKRIWYSLAYGATQEQIATMLEVDPSNERLEEISIGYKVELRDYQRQAIKEAKKEPRPTKSKAKGPRNRWGVVK